MGVVLLLKTTANMKVMILMVTSFKSLLIPSLEVMAKQNLLVSQRSCKVLLNVSVHHRSKMKILAITQQIYDEYLWEMKK